MTSPNTNIETQTRRHKAPIIGFIVVLAFAGIMAFVWAGGDDLTEDDAQDGATAFESEVSTDS